MFCTNCGNKVPDAARFCPDCGSPVKAAPARGPGGPKDSTLGDALLGVVRTNQVDSVRRLIAAGADVNARTRGGHTAVIVAAGKGNSEMVTLLITAGADVNLKPADGTTALGLAAQDGHAIIVQDLLAAGADVNAKYTDGTTALMLAAHEGHTDTVRVLLGHRPGLNAKAEPSGFTALMLAAGKGYFEITAALLAAGADPWITDGRGSTALALAKRGGHSKVVELLESAGKGVPRDLPSPSQCPKPEPGPSAEDLLTLFDQKPLWTREDFQENHMRRYLCITGLNADAWRRVVDDYESSIDAMERDDPETAAHLAGRAIDVFPGFAEAYLQQAAAYRDMEDWPRCLETLNRMDISIAEEVPDRHFFRGVALANTGRLDDALAEALKEIAVSGPSHDVLSLLIFIYHLRGQQVFDGMEHSARLGAKEDREQAERSLPLFECTMVCYDRALRLDPDPQSKATFLQVCAYVESLRPGRVRRLTGISPDELPPLS